MSTSAFNNRKWTVSILNNTLGLLRVPWCLALCSSAPAPIGWQWSCLWAILAPDLMLLLHNAVSVLLIVVVSLHSSIRQRHQTASEGPGLCLARVHNVNKRRETGSRQKIRLVNSKFTTKLYCKHKSVATANMSGTQLLFFFVVFFNISFLLAKVSPTLVVHYIMACENGARATRLGYYIFNKNTKCIALGYCWHSTVTACAFISKVIHSKDYATSSGDGSMQSVPRGTACSTVSIYIQIQ